MKIFAFGHEKRVGKDTCCKYLMSYLRTQRKGIHVQKHGFADKLKDQCYDLFSWAGLQDTNFYEIEENAYMREVVLPALDRSPRQIWIEYGNKLRDIYKDVWIDYLLKQISCDVLLIKDLRYPNEVEKIKEVGGYVIKVENTNIPPTSDVADDALRGFTGWNEIVTNNNQGDFNNIYKQMVSLAEKYI